MAGYGDFMGYGLNAFGLHLFLSHCHSETDRYATCCRRGVDGFTHADERLPVKLYSTIRVLQRDGGFSNSPMKLDVPVRASVPIDPYTYFLST